MKKQTHYLRLVLLLVVSLPSCFQAMAQNTNDFWLAFEKCAQVPAFQAHYPAANGSPTHYVMNHGIEVPSPEGVAFTSGSTFATLDKSGIVDGGKTSFFLIHEAKVESATATFDMVYYYNFDGSYNTFVAATITLAKSNGVWTVTQAIIK